MIRALLLSACLALATTAAAHDDWPAACCSDRDCAEVLDRFIREDGDLVHIDIPPGAHPMWGPEKTTNFRQTIARSKVLAPIKGGWGVCISPGGNLLCTFFPKRFG